MIIERYEDNPVLKPNRNHSWEAEAVFNGCPVERGENIYLLYRAQSLPHYHALAKQRMTISDIGIAKSRDGVKFTDRKRLIIPEEQWERFGCEDPRVTKLDGKYYVFYTALSVFPFRADGIKVGVAISKDLKSIDEKHLVTPFNAKGMAMFPERIGGKIWCVLTVNTDRPPAKICFARFDNEKDMWSNTYWSKWYRNFDKYSLPLQRRPEDQIEVGAPPVKTEYGWLLIYSYIRGYFSGSPFFGVEAVLLDLKDPYKIIARTEFPILTPEEYYERIGFVPNIVFPSGTLIRKNKLYLYYGAADTTCCLAKIEISSLLDNMLKKGFSAIKFNRNYKNPILSPRKENSWESKAVFNAGAIYLEGKVHLLYRAMSQDNISSIGYAASKDGIVIDYRSPKPAYIPREPFESKGCEDPRLTQIGNKIYMFYTAFNGQDLPRVAMTYINLKDFLAQKWNWTKPSLLSPPEISDKDACLFPEKVKGKYLILHRGRDDIDISASDTLDFKEGEWLEEYRLVTPRKGWWDSRRIGSAAPPIKTVKGWLLLYHGISEDNVYRVGAVLLDLQNPLKVIARTDNPIFEPREQYEKEGLIPNVVFPCGTVLLGEDIFMYYGGADKVIGLATIKLSYLLDRLVSCKC